MLKFFRSTKLKKKKKLRYFLSFYLCTQDLPILFNKLIGEKCPHLSKMSRPDQSLIIDPPTDLKFKGTFVVIDICDPFHIFCHGSLA